jgi:hypothetical protein
MNIILIAEHNHYRNWIGKCYSDLLLYYYRNSKNKVSVIYTDQYHTYNNASFIKLNPDIIVFLDTDTLRFANHFSYVFKLDCKVFASSLDLFYFNDCINCPWIKKCDGILFFGHASKLLTSYKQYFPRKIIKSFKGRFVNSNKYKNNNQEKKYDILIYGSRNVSNTIEKHQADQYYKQTWESYYKKKLPSKWYFYPLRKRLEQLLIKNKDKYNLYIVSNACIFNAPIANENLSKLINQSWLTIATSSRADIPMAKYFEIGASYSTILGNIPSDYNDLFKNNIVEVTEWMTDEEILSTIDKALEDKQKLQEKINILGNIIHKEYNLDAAVKDMDRVFEDIMDSSNNMYI